MLRTSLITLILGFALSTALSLEACAVPADLEDPSCARDLATQSAFSNEVETYLRENQTDLYAVMKSAKARQRFFARPAIQSFLTRPAARLDWDLNHPLLTPVHDPAGYEAEIYQRTKALIPFRNDHGRDEFYRSGTPNEALPFLAELLRRQHPGVFIARPLDLYDVRHFVNKITRPQASLNANYPNADQALARAARARVLIFPMAKDAHMASVVVIFDPAQRRPLVALWIDTSKSTESYAYYAHRWNLTDYYRYHLDEEKFKSLANLPLVLGDGRPSTDQSTARIDHVENYLGRVKMLVMNKSIPFIDASHHLQSDEDDLNCSLYTYNFLDAAGRLVSRDLDRIFDLARGIADHGADSTPLVRLFEEGTKPYLPQYFDASGHRRSLQALKHYHLHLRWALGSEYVRELARPRGFFEAE